MNNVKKVWLGYAAVAVGLAVLPFLVGSTLGNSWVRILDFALLYVMLALGLNIVVGFAGLLDLGYIAFYAVGAYLYALLASNHFDLHFAFYTILPLGALLACIFGILLGAPTLKLRGDYLAIVTLGFGEIVRLFMNNLDRPVNITNGPQGIDLIDPIKLQSYSLSQGFTIAGERFGSAYAYYYLFLLAMLLVVFICIRLENSRIGRAWVAIREDEVAAQAMGINTRNIKLLAFAMGASFGGVAGGLFAGFQGFVSPESFTLMESVMVLCMVVLGGMGHIPGVILGAVLLTVTPEILRETINPLQRSLFGKIVVDPENFRMVLFGLALILVMLFRPAGLWPSRRRKQELGGDAHE
ncbi:MAG TPA: ABC transporter ATP-binding protein [Pseudomonadales bacterium]|nr:ABC transporter ATP-binding protein [Pseudomonadales bacterium]